MQLLLFLALAQQSEFAGAAACAPCHVKIAEAQKKTGHAGALRRSQPGEPGEWAFGAGTQAHTFVSKAAPGVYLEHGLSFYPRLNRMARTPGHRTEAGVKYRLFDPSAGILRCFACHSTGPVTLEREDKSEGASEDKIVPHEMGVRCESCHGASAAHAKSPATVKPMNPGKLDGYQLNELCGACHRRPEGAEATPNLRDPWNARHQPLTLAASKCFRASEGKLTCFTCHAAHEAKPAPYDAACQSCHKAVEHRTPKVAKQSCTSCHMPLVKPVPGLEFSNHRIGRYAAGDSLTPLP